MTVVELLLAFGVTLVLAVLVSELGHRSVLSTTILFLVAGVVAGPVLSVLRLEPGEPLVLGVANVALFSVLVTDGMRVSAKNLASAWELPGRALFLGMPLTLGATAAVAYLLAGVSWTQALLVGAMLAPTDPVFAAPWLDGRRSPGAFGSC